MGFLEKTKRLQIKALNSPRRCVVNRGQIKKHALAMTVNCIAPIQLQQEDLK